MWHLLFFTSLAVHVRLQSPHQSRTQIDVSVNSAPTTEGLNFSFKMTNPISSGYVYWDLTQDNVKLNSFDVRHGAQSAPGCSGRANQGFDERDRFVEVHCRLVPNHTYLLWVVIDLDGRGKGASLVTPDGVPLKVPQETTTASISITSKSANGIKFRYALTHPEVGANLYWSIVQGSKDIQVTMMQDGFCHGYSPVHDSKQHEIKANCKLANGHYKLFLAVDTNGATKMLTTRGVGFDITNAAKPIDVQCSIPKILPSGFTLSYNVATPVTNGRLYFSVYSDENNQQEPTARGIISGTASVIHGFFDLRHMQQPHSEFVKVSLDPGMAYTVYFATVLDGRLEEAAKPKQEPLQFVAPRQIAVAVKLDAIQTTGFNLQYSVVDTDATEMHLIYWGVSKNDDTVTCDDLFTGQNVFKSGLIQAVVATSVKVIDVPLSEGEQYQLWACFDDENGDLISVDGSGKTFEVPVSTKVSVNVDLDSMNLLGFEFSYDVTGRNQEGSIFYTVTSADVKLTAEEVLSGKNSLADGTLSEQGGTETVDVDLAPGESYLLWIACDQDGTQTSLTLSPSITIDCPKTTLRVFANDVTQDQFTLNYQVLFPLPGASFYYILTPKSFTDVTTALLCPPDSSLLAAGKVDIPLDEAEHTVQVSTNNALHQEGIYSLWTAMDTDGACGGVELTSDFGIVVTLSGELGENETGEAEVDFLVSPKLITSQGFSLDYRFSALCTNGFLYWSLTPNTVDHYTAENVVNGDQSVVHGVESQEDMKNHVTAISADLESGTSYLLWAAHICGDSKPTLLRTNLVEVQAIAAPLVPQDRILEPILPMNNLPSNLPMDNQPNNLPSPKFIPTPIATEPDCKVLYSNSYCEDGQIRLPRALDWMMCMDIFLNTPSCGSFFVYNERRNSCSCVRPHVRCDFEHATSSNVFFCKSRAYMLPPQYLPSFMRPHHSPSYGGGHPGFRLFMDHAYCAHGTGHRFPEQVLSATSCFHQVKMNSDKCGHFFFYNHGKQDCCCLGHNYGCHATPSAGYSIFQVVGGHPHSHSYYPQSNDADDFPSVNPYHPHSFGTTDEDDFLPHHGMYHPAMTDEDDFLPHHVMYHPAATDEDDFLPHPHSWAAGNDADDAIQPGFATDADDSFTYPGFGGMAYPYTFSGDGNMHNDQEEYFGPEDVWLRKNQNEPRSDGDSALQSSFLDLFLVLAVTFVLTGTCFLVGHWRRVRKSRCFGLMPGYSLRQEDLGEALNI